MKSKKEEFIDALISGGMMDNIYGYAYNRCFSKDEAEDLCQEIITEILLALTNNGYVENLNAYIWRIANNTYVNHINRKKRIHSVEDMSSNINAVFDANMEDDIIERIVDRENLAIIKREIASLSEIYRDVMVMYYLDELPMYEIAQRLNIPENRVKQRLYTAREKIKKEVLDMDKIKQPIKLYDLNPAFWRGDLFKYDPRDKISSLLRKNIIISCRKTAKTIQELSDEFNVELAIMKDEINQIPEDFLKKTSDEKYIANQIVIDIELQKKIDKLTADIAKDYFKDVKEYLLSKKDEIMSLPYINPPKSFEYLLWWYLPQFSDTVRWLIGSNIAEKLKENNIKAEERKTLYVCEISDPEKGQKTKSRNHNGIWNVFNMLGQHEEVRIDNIHIEDFIPWSKGRFWAGQSFNDFPELAMVFKTIGGLDVDSIEESDKEAAAKALEKGYIRKDNGKLYPAVTIATENTLNYLMLNKSGDVYDKENKYAKNNQMFAAAKSYGEKIADELWDCSKRELPEHLLYLSETFAQGVIKLDYYLYAEGVKDGILYELPETGCTEGIMASIHYPQLKIQYEEMEKIARGEVKPEELKDGFLNEYKISEIYKNGIGEKIGLQVGDVMTAVNGIDWKDYWKNEKWTKSNGENWKEDDVITVERNGEKIDFTVNF